jgi:DNA-binding GntR family transcriptional regulator
MTFAQIQQLSLREQVVEQIRTAIIQGRLKPNDHIVEAALTQEMGVSRTPVREALILLEREGLVIASPNRGCFVRAYNQNDVREIFSMRTNLENFAAELIVERLRNEDFELLEGMIEQQRLHIERNDFMNVRRIDMEFHHYLIHYSHHSLLIRIWKEIVAQIAALLYVRAEGLDYDEYLAIRDHKAIVEAYKNRDLAGVQRCNRAINERVAGECMAALEILIDRPV